MSFELISQIEDLFKDHNQWSAFLDISNQRNSIRDNWFRDFMVMLNKKTKPILPWTFTSFNLLDYRWYISDYGVDSFCIRLGNWGNKFTLWLWASQSKNDIKKLSEYLNHEKYGEILKNKFSHIDYIGNEGTDWKYVEHLSLTFDKKYDAVDLENCSWFAHYKTQEMVEQVLIEIDNFINDEECTNTIKELNKLTLL